MIVELDGRMFILIYLPATAPILLLALTMVDMPVHTMRIGSA